MSETAHHGYVCLDPATGVITGFCTSLSAQSAIVESASCVKIDMAQHGGKLTPDLPRRYFFKAGAFVALPPDPGPEYALDPVSKTWRADAARLRQRRDVLLTASDWTQMPDVPLATKTAWANYRQELRDITKQPGWPMNISWPKAPT